MVPDCVTQYMIQDIETLSISIDMQHMEKKLNMMLDILLSIGYKIPVKPQGTFYLLVMSPLEDDQAFCHLLSKYNILCLPGSVCFIPGYFRISLTANEDMIQRSQYGFKEAYQQAISSNNE
jgi:aspartate aminotransferase